MGGFLVGSLALIVLYVAVQPGTAGAAQAGGNVLVAGLRRALSADVAGIPPARAGSTGAAVGSAAAGAAKAAADAARGN